MRNMVGNIFMYKSLKQWKCSINAVTAGDSLAVFLALMT